jgi:hypothetical protein
MLNEIYYHVDGRQLTVGARSRNLENMWLLLYVGVLPHFRGKQMHSCLVVDGGNDDGRVLEYV